MHPLLRAAAERQLGLFTAAQARRAGYQHSEVRHLLSTGAWVRLRPGVYVRADHPSALRTADRRHRVECLAVLLALDRPTAVISHTSAARLWALPVRRGLDPTVRLSDPDQWRRRPDYRMAQVRLTADDVTVRAPFRLTTVPRTLIDCAREWDLEDAVVAMDAALLRGRTTPSGLRDAAAAVQRWPGARCAARAVDLADGRAESPLETRGRLRIVGAGLPSPELQVEIRAAGRLVAVVDAWFDDAAVAVEFDGRVKYTDPWRGRSPEQVLWNEKRREDELRSLDIRVARVADADLGGPWARIEGRLRGLLATSGPADRRFTATPRAHGIQRAG